MIGNLNTRQMRHLEQSKPAQCQQRRYDYQGTVHAVGTDIPIQSVDGWVYQGYKREATEDGKGHYLVATWRREVLL